jgi:hypothetical protein
MQRQIAGLLDMLRQMVGMLDNTATDGRNVGYVATECRSVV